MLSCLPLENVSISRLLMVKLEGYHQLRWLELTSGYYDYMILFLSIGTQIITRGIRYGGDGKVAFI